MPDFLIACSQIIKTFQERNRRKRKTEVQHVPESFTDNLLQFLTDKIHEHNSVFEISPSVVEERQTNVHSIQVDADSFEVKVPMMAEVTKNNHLYNVNLQSLKYLKQLVGDVMKRMHMEPPHHVDEEDVFNSGNECK